MMQQVEVKRYNQWNILVEIYTDTVTIPELPEYPDLKTQLKAEEWTMRFPRAIRSWTNVLALHFSKIKA